MNKRKSGESRTFAEQSKVLKTDEAKKRYFLVFEGASTEKIYFEALENARDDVGIDPWIICMMKRF